MEITVIKHSAVGKSEMALSNILTKENSLHFVLRAEWFNKIASGEKTHEYREYKPYWCRRILAYPGCPKFLPRPVEYARFTLGMTKDPNKTMIFRIKNIGLARVEDTDLKDFQTDSLLAFDIELGERLA